MNPSLSQRIKEAMSRLPFITEHLPGLGGVLKADPEHFKVEEILPYAPCGEGEHLFVTVRRSGWNTADVAQAMAKRFGLKNQDVGWGGRKDKHAVTTQTFSLRLPLALPADQAHVLLQQLPFEILALKRHGNKLKTGHVAGNRFQITLSQVAPASLDKALAIAGALTQTGLPNYYGEQRFGHHMHNIDRAAALMQHPHKSRSREDAFTVSVLQSALFNLWLKTRIERGDFSTLLLGDVAKKTDTGGLFVVDDVNEAAQRFEAHQIVYTGPIYGHKMMAAAYDAGDYEAHILTAFQLDLQAFKPLRANGSRRTALLYLNDLAIEPCPSGLQFTFSLPSGAYATTVLREFMRPSSPL
jgi:tRNA pseudouridine13 synthase